MRIGAALARFSHRKNLTPHEAAVLLVLLGVIWAFSIWNSYPTYPPISRLRYTRLSQQSEIRSLTPVSRVAYATFLAENATPNQRDDNDDWYYVATRVMAYHGRDSSQMEPLSSKPRTFLCHFGSRQVLRDGKTNLSNYDFSSWWNTNESYSSTPTPFLQET